MCAIAGIVSLDSASQWRESLQKMLQDMQRRGPDSSYTYGDKNFFGGMNRLSINDLDFGAQPFINASGDIVVFFNGEIYNYVELKNELKQDGITFKSHCDGEILPFLYAKYDVECFAKLDGMFGICIYDKVKNKVILARDLMGEKPLFFCKNKKSFCFSTLSAPLKRICEATLNPCAVWDFLTFGFIPEPQSIYKEVFAIPKGSYLSLDCESLEYEICDFSSESLAHFAIPYLENVGDRDLVEITRKIVKQSVENRLLSDVPVGAFLSGGLDSSVVVGCAAQKIEKLRTFNIAFDDGYDPYCGFVDESVFAKQVAKAFGVEHFSIRVNAKSFQTHLMDFIDNIDAPFGVISGIGISMIAKKARELGIKVLLSGDGADENFGGYSWYPKLRFSDMRFINDEKPKGWHYYAFESEKKSLLNAEFFGDSRAYFPALDSKPLAFIEFDRGFYLPFEMMVKLDRMCMGQSVEGRACFVSPSIISFTRNLSYATLLKQGEKWLLKEAFKDMLPIEIIERQKHGFNAPVDYWIKNDWLGLLEEVFADNSALHQYGILRKGAREFFMPLLFGSDRRVGSIAFFLIVLNLWLQRNK